MPAFLEYGDITCDAAEPAHRGWFEPTGVQFGQEFRNTPGDPPP